MALNKAQQAAVKTAANYADIPVDIALGIVDQESAGVTVWNIPGKGAMPPIRPETHKFYAYLKGEKRDRAVKAGLAAKKAGAIPIPGKPVARYAFFDRMLAIDETAALMSISMGIGQVMGFNYKAAGYDTVQDMWTVAKSGFDGQVSVMFNFIDSQSAIKHAMSMHDYITVARLYNGPNWKKNNYAAELEKHTNQYAGSRVPVYIQSDTGLSWLGRAQALGFDTVEAFQSENGLTPDGKAGPITRDAIEKAEKARKKQVGKPASTAAKTAAIATVAGSAAAVAEQANSVADTVSPIVGTLSTIAASGPIVVIGIAGIVAVAAISAFVYFKFIKK